MSGWGKKCALTAGSVTLSLFAGEIALRTMLPQIAWHVESDTSLGWSSREYKRFNPTVGRGSTRTHRILFLGDSNLAGSGGLGSLDERFPIVLGQRLADRAEVQILASGGWGTDQQLLAFLQKGRHWRPDIVVLTFTAYNDLANVLSNSSQPRHRKPYFALDPTTETLQLFDTHGALLAQRARKFDQQGVLASHLIDLIRFQLARVKAKPAARSDATSPAPQVDPRYLLYSQFLSQEIGLKRTAQLRQHQAELDWSPQNGVNNVSAYIAEDFELNRYAWQLLEAILLDLKREVEATEAQLIVMLLPIPFDPRDPQTIPGGDFERVFATPTGSFTFRAGEPRERLSAICSRAGIEFFDPTQRFIETVISEDRVEAYWPVPHNTHLSSLGHAKLAEILQEYLASRR